MKVAIVHEFLTQFGGAERVLQNFFEIWPDAQGHVLINKPKKVHGIFNDFKIKASYLNGIPYFSDNHKLLLPLMTTAIESFNFNDYDLVLSDSSSFAKGLDAAGKLHICYCHTPTRFLWSDYHSYIDQQPYPAFLRSIAKRYLLKLRAWDFQAAQKPNFLIANSLNVKKRIAKYYNRDCTVIYPPVDTEFYKPNAPKEDFYLVASRLEPYKKVDIIVEAFNRLGLKLKVAGTGTMLDKLKQMAKPNVEFLGWVSDEDLRTLYSASLGFIFAAEEDAGIMLLESQSCGTPAIAYAAGGAMELVKESETGTLFKDQTPDSIVSAIKRYHPENFKQKYLVEHAKQFDKQVFKAKVKDFVEKKYQERQGGIK
jgi:glycosyltransferase involved in cell wall biosynthesis